MEYIEQDGYLIDPETGEIVKIVEPEGFRVKDDESLAWVMEKILRADAEAEAVWKTPEVIAATAILENATKIRNEKENRAAWLRMRFAQEVQEYVASKLEGQKARSLKTLYGTVSLRHVKGGLRVVDADKALEWAKVNAPEAVEVKERFLISRLDTDNIAKAEAAASFHGPFHVESDREVVAIKTGVEK